MTPGSAPVGAIAYGVYQELRGKRAAFGASLSHGMSRLGSLILVAILVGLGVGIGTLLLVIPMTSRSHLITVF